jgi:protein-S-isoprenylcysteine O-methyltransferase Ste14/pimeloyl-ACP methyl ester carboxylesterase
MLLRAVTAFIALPGLAAFAVPLAVVWYQAPERSITAIGLIPFLAGTALLLWCVCEFFVRGAGTLAPWAPPRHLVTSGPYRVSRNPMYVAVTIILLGWALAFRSAALVLYALGMMTAFHLRVVLAEEPWLARRHEREWTRYAATVPRWIFPNRTALVASWLALSAALPIGGLLYEAVAEARAARQFAPPGVLVDVGGRRLHVLCVGEGTPTVIFEASGWGNALSSPAVRERLARRTTVCSYDRRGAGWSDPADGLATAGALANDLGVLQDRAALRWPFVIVASSIGGLTAEMFARFYPERAAGLVFVDAASSLSLPMLASRSGTVTFALCSASALAEFGVLRLLDPFGLGSDTESARRSAALTYSGPSASTLCSMGRGFAPSMEEFGQARPLGRGLPITVLSASSADDLLPPGAARFVDVAALKSEFERTHQLLAEQSDRGAWRRVPDSTHLIGESQPDEVADAVFDLLDALETGDRRPRRP